MRGREAFRGIAEIVEMTWPALKRGVALFLIALAVTVAAAQEGFGFDEPGETADAPSAASAGASGASVGGMIEFGTSAFVDTSVSALDTPLEGLATGILDFKAAGSSVEASLSLKITEKALSQDPESLVDQASVRIFSGPLTLEGGLLKVSWGKADSLGPLDVLNPFDHTDLSVTDTMELKIARPMLRASLALGDLSKLEIVGLVGYEGNRMAFEGPWTPKAIAGLKTSAYNGFYYGSNSAANNGLGNGLYANYYSTAWATAYTGAFPTAYESAYTEAYTTAMTSGPTAGNATASAAAAADSATGMAISDAAATANAACAANAAAIAAQAKEAAEGRVAKLLDYPDTDTVEWTQGGARFTTSLGPVDLGLQYFYGFLPNPAVSSDPAALAANGYRAAIDYNRYHQAGADMATVLAGFNLRAELAANLTEDMEGDDPGIYNPHLAWSFGFDRTLFAGISLNLQGDGKYRLFEEGVGESPYDIEKGSDRARIRITGFLSRKFMKDALEAKVAAVYGVQDEDYMIMPGLSYSIGDARMELAAGIFGGDEDGELGQFSESSYARITIGYEF